MEKKKFISREVKIGIVVIIAIGMLYFGLNYLKGVNIFKPDTYFYAKYDRVDGIVKTTHVYVNGFQVGHISDIIFDYSKEAPIKEKGQRVPASISFVPSTAGLIIAGEVIRDLIK